MGTRADFYIGRGEDAEWLGSIAWDGYPKGTPAPLLVAKNEKEFREAVATIASTEDDFTSPEDGWPWPWEDSNITDYAYTFDGGEVYYTVDYRPNRWWKHSGGKPPEEDDSSLKDLPIAIFPNMKSRQNIAKGSQKSGIVTVTFRTDGKVELD